MSSSLFGNSASQTGQSSNPNLFQQINRLKQMLHGQNPNAVMEMMAQKNPQFAQFVSECRGMTPEQICQKYGVNWADIKNMMGR